MRAAGTITEQDALQILGGSRRPAEHAVDYAPPRPPIYGESERWAALEAMTPACLPATRVLELPGAQVQGARGWVVVDDRAITSLSWWESHALEPNLAGDECTRERRLDGTLLNLATMMGKKNYGHFLLDGLGRLAVTELAGIRVEEVDWVLVPGFDTAATRRMLDAAEIPPEKRIVPRRALAVTPDVVLAPSMPGTTRVYRPSLPRYLRTLSQPAARAPRRLYITRPDDARRPLTNRPELARLAMSHGFTPIDPMGSDLAALMGSADVVLGEHGAALADLAFCRPGTRVIELIPSDHMHPYYFSLAMAADLDYAAVVCRSAEVRPPDRPGPSPHSVEVPLDALSDALAALPA
ncbi:MAG: hypothetical protein QOI15_2507 [Pseudonocardiales bacterium]|nr:hypothetical protein [Pseudonocardiales bacterium]